jgi:hypothetical protein
LAWRLPLVGLGLIVAAVLPALFGGSYRAEADPERYAFALYAVTALGIAVAADRVLRAITPARSAIARRVAVGLLVVAVVWELRGGGDLFAARDDRDAAILGTTVAAATRDDAVVIVPWDWATPLAYRAYVENAFGRRIVLCAFPEDYADRIGGWLRTRQVAIVAEVPPLVPGFTVRRLRAGNPGVFEVIDRMRSSARR